MKLCQNINLYAVSLLVDYSHLFSEEEKRNINNYIDKIELYIELLKGFKQLLIKGECHSSIHKKFKVIAQEIFEIENLLKKYSIKVWKNELTDVKKFRNGNNYTLVSTPKIIKFNQLYDDSTVTISEIILDRMKSKTEGILCYVYGNEFLSYSRKFAEKLGTKFNLPVLYIDKMLYKGENISEYEVYEKFEIVDGIRQFLNNDVQKNIYDLSKWQYDIEEETYLNIFREVCKENPKSTVEAKRIVERIARKILQQNELER